LGYIIRRMKTSTLRPVRTAATRRAAAVAGLVAMVVQLDLSIAKLHAPAHEERERLTAELQGVREAIRTLTANHATA
jgi:hypothetical protein